MLLFSSVNREGAFCHLLTGVKTIRLVGAIQCPPYVLENNLFVFGFLNIQYGLIYQHLEGGRQLDCGHGKQT